MSTDDFIVPPPPFVVSDVATASRFSFATATTVTVSTASKIALRLFDGTVGQRVSLLGTNGLTGQVLGCDISVTVLNPVVSPLAAATCMEGSGFMDVKTLTKAGTHTILVDPASTATGSVTLTLYDVPADYSNSITAGGSSVIATMLTPGQNGNVTFSGTSVQRVSLLGTTGINGQISAICDVNVSILKPDGSVLAAPSCMESGGYIDVLTLPATGTYRIVVDPTSWATGNLTLELEDVPADYNNGITAGGSEVTVAMPTAGQNGVLTFAGTSGQRISLKGTNGVNGYILGCDVNAKILKPDTTELVANTCVEGNSFIEVQTLPATGTYTIVVDPVNHARGNVTFKLYTVPADTTGTVTIGGLAVGVPLDIPGQNGTLTFSGTASQQVTVRMTSNSDGWVTVRLKKPDGSLLTSLTGFGNFNLVTQTLPTTGTYTIEVDPNGFATGSINVAVTNP